MEAGHKGAPTGHLSTYKCNSSKHKLHCKAKEDHRLIPLLQAMLACAHTVSGIVYNLLIHAIGITKDLSRFISILIKEWQILLNHTIFKPLLNNMQAAFSGVASASL